MRRDDADVDPTTTLLSAAPPDDATDCLVAGLRAFAGLRAGERLAVTLAEFLLILLSVHRIPIVDDADEHDVNDMAALIEEAALVVGEEPSAVISARSCEELLKWALDRTADGGGDQQQHRRRALRVARAIALAVDASRHTHFVEHFRAQGEITVSPQRAFPVVSSLKRQWLGAHSANTRPERLPSPRADVLPHLRLGEPVSAYAKFVLDLDSNGRLSPLASAPSLRIATLHPNVHFDEFDIAFGERTFVNRGPTDSDEQVRRLCLLIKRAASAGANVVVIPEYSLAWPDREEVQECLSQLNPRPVLVVGGTALVTGVDSFYRVNEAIVWAGDYAFSQAKTFPAEVLQHLEAIHVDPVPLYRVFVSADLAIAVLVCRDAMSPDVVAQLAAIGVDICLVPAFSDRTTSLAANVCVLRTLSQAFVVVANVGSTLTWPKKGFAADAVFDGPYEATPNAVVCPGPEGRPAVPGFWLFDSAARTSEWVSMKAG